MGLELHALYTCISVYTEPVNEAVVSWQARKELEMKMGEGEVFGEQTRTYGGMKGGGGGMKETLGCEENKPAGKRPHRQRPAAVPASVSPFDASKTRQSAQVCASTEKPYLHNATQNCTPFDGQSFPLPFAKPY